MDLGGVSGRSWVNMIKNILYKIHKEFIKYFSKGKFTVQTNRENKGEFVPY